MPIGKLVIVVVNGLPRSGKDTFTEMCLEYISSKHGYLTHNISSVDEVKKAAVLLGWDSVKDEKGRAFLSELKDLSTQYYDGPFKHMRHEIDSRRFQNCNHAFFFHIREPDEIRKFVQGLSDICSVVTVILEREEGEAHHINTGDSGVYDYKYKYAVTNNGTLLDLKEHAEFFMEDII